jgi:hypothetical protein
MSDHNVNGGKRGELKEREGAVVDGRVEVSDTPDGVLFIDDVEIIMVPEDPTECGDSKRSEPQTRGAPGVENIRSNVTAKRQQMEEIGRFVITTDHNCRARHARFAAQ